jgi:hypothetical protein
MARGVYKATGPWDNPLPVTEAITLCQYCNPLVNSLISLLPRYSLCKYHRDIEIIDCISQTISEDIVTRGSTHFKTLGAVKSLSVDYIWRIIDLGRIHIRWCNHCPRRHYSLVKRKEDEPGFRGPLRRSTRLNPPFLMFTAPFSPRDTCYICGYVESRKYIKEMNNTRKETIGWDVFVWAVLANRLTMERKQKRKQEDRGEVAEAEGSPAQYPVN